MERKTYFKAINGNIVRVQQGNGQIVATVYIELFKTFHTVEVYKYTDDYVLGGSRDVQINWGGTRGDIQLVKLYANALTTAEIVGRLIEDGVLENL